MHDGGYWDDLGHAHPHTWRLVDPSLVFAPAAAQPRVSAWCVCAGGDVPTPSSDTRAELLLDIMLGTLQQQAEPPNLAHLLLGFDSSTPPTQWYYQELQPQHDYSCLSVLLRALQVCGREKHSPSSWPGGANVAHVA